jgi:hypothetical protein
LQLLKPFLLLFLLFGLFGIVLRHVAHSRENLVPQPPLLRVPPPQRVVVLVCFASESVQNAQRLLLEEAQETGWFTDFEVWNPERLREELPACPSASEDWVAQNRRGYGYMTWKPFILEHAVEKYHGLYPRRPVYVVYLDSGCVINPQGWARFEEYLSMAEKTGAVTFGLGSDLPNIAWCKDSVLRRVPGALQAAHDQQLISGVMVLNAHAPNVHSVVREFRRFAALDHGQLFTDALGPERSQQRPEFVEHRHDQSIWSLVANGVGFTNVFDETYHENSWLQTGLGVPFWTKRRR